MIKFFKIKKSLLASAVTLYLISLVSYAQELPAEVFGQLPDVTKVRLSPNGHSIASLVRYEKDQKTGLYVYVQNLKTGKSKVLTSTDNSKFVIGWMDWANDEELLVSIRYPSSIYRTPVTRTQLLKISAVTGKMNNIIPTNVIKRSERVPVIQDNVIDMLPERPDELIISFRPGNAVGTNVFRINHRTKRAKSLHRVRRDTLDWITDRQNNLRIAYRFDNTTTSYDYREVGAKKWQALFEFEVFSKESATPIGFDQDPNILYYSALHNGKRAIYRTNLLGLDGNKELVLSDPKYDVNGQLVYSYKSKMIVGISHSLGSNYLFWDEGFKGIIDSVNKALPDTSNDIVGFSRDERKFIIMAASGSDPGQYLYWDRDAGTMQGFASRYEKIEPRMMAEKKSIEYKARDGLAINGYLTRPINHSNKAGPAIIFPHGGPIGHTGRGFDYWTQFFANRGYNVLQMNFRGSSGYGFDFMSSGLKNWGGKMQSDVEDGTRWLIKQGIADPNRICVIGASYGGYAALMEAANNPDLYQCAVSFAGVTDLPQLLDSSRRYINYEVVKEMIGSNRKQLKARSPTNRASEINIPVLLAHGTKDISVPIKQGRKMHRRLKKQRKDVTYLEFEDGTHYLENEEHRVKWFKEMDSFLKKHLR